jgi:hypothetical protein
MIHKQWIFLKLQSVHNSQTTKKKVSLQNAHHSQKIIIKKVALWRHAHKCVIFVHSQNAQKETKTHTTHDVRIFGDDGIMSVIAKMRRKKKTRVMKYWWCRCCGGDYNIVSFHKLTLQKQFKSLWWRCFLGCL